MKLSATVQKVVTKVNNDDQPHRIDILNRLKGVTFEECYDSRIEAKIDGININFIDLDNLRKNKKATGRLQDLADLEKLQ